MNSFKFHPRTVWWRRAAFQVHLWVGAGLSLYIAVIGLSGSILVFKEELLPKPKLERSFKPGPCSATALLSVMDLVARANPSAKITLALCPTDIVPFYATTTEFTSAASNSQERLVVYSDAVSGKPAGAFDVERSWVNWIEEFHSDLLAGPRGRFWNGVGAALLVALCVTGLVVWWPGVRAWRRALIVRGRGNWKRINWDLHSATGFWTFSIVFLWALTGAFFTWPNQFEKAIGIISPVTTAKLLFPTVPIRGDGRRSLDLPQMLAKAQVASPHGRLAGLFYGLGPGKPFTIYMARERLGDYATTDFVYFNPYTGAYLDTWHRGENRGTGDFIYWLLGPLHFGTRWGLMVKIAWSLLGLALPLLAGTGLLMYWNRYLSKHVDKRNRCQPEGSAVDCCDILRAGRRHNDE